MNGHAKAHLVNLRPKDGARWEFSLKHRIRYLALAGLVQGILCFGRCPTKNWYTQTDKHRFQNSSHSASFSLFTYRHSSKYMIFCVPILTFVQQININHASSETSTKQQTQQVTNNCILQQTIALQRGPPHDSGGGLVEKSD